MRAGYGGCGTLDNCGPHRESFRQPPARGPEWPYSKSVRTPERNPLMKDSSQSV